MLPLIHCLAQNWTFTFKVCLQNYLFKNVLWWKFRRTTVKSKYTCTFPSVVTAPNTVAEYGDQVMSPTTLLRS